MKASLTALLLALALSACSTTIHPDDYDRSCSNAAECVPIFAGDVCDCSCDSSAINVADYERYLDDRDVECSADCGPCPAVHVVCSNGLCEAEPR